MGLIKPMVFSLWSWMKSHKVNANAHHTDHQAASSENATFKKLDINQTAGLDSLLVKDGGANVMQILDGGVINLAKQSMAYIIFNGSPANIPSGGEHTLDFNTVITDVQSEYNTGTYKFKAKTAGNYFVAAKITWDNLPANTVGYICLKVGAVYLASMWYRMTGKNSVMCFGVVALALNDEMYANINQGSGAPQSMASGTNGQFYIHKLS